MEISRYTTKGGMHVAREICDQEYQPAGYALAQRLDERRGVLLSSSFEFPGRYTRWDMGFVDPPLVFTAQGRRFAVESLNPRGRTLLRAATASLSNLPAVRFDRIDPDLVKGEVAQTDERFPEELRSRQPSVFSLLRALIDLFHASEDQHLGFYGAFGYDLVF
ncbi:MAG: anthranilate synthase component I, partial [Alphaproteobacteria bacterium]|nr:anthranilate synthase component I [Alphaproteobacteria bacterium]